MLSSISWRTPPHGYGPWEQVTSHLTEALVAKGVDVTLFATQDSMTSGHLAGPVARGYSEDRDIDAKTWELLHVAHLFERADEFDIIHNHADIVPLAFSRLVDTPVVTTIHGFSSERILPIFRSYDDRVAYVAISDTDRHPDLTYAATIHHGINIDDFPFDPVGGPNLLFFGRIHPDKGASDAIRAAMATGHRLEMAGIIQDHDYHQREVAPFIDGDRIVHVGVVGGSHRAALLGRSRALLHLIGFDEPFGLSVVEAMACGTPVIAYRRGSMAELIDDGVTGFLVDSFDEAIAAIGRIGEIDRAACRKAATARFGVERMAEDYIALYEDLIRKAPRRTPKSHPAETNSAVDARQPPAYAAGAWGKSGSVTGKDGQVRSFDIAFSWMDKGLVEALEKMAPIPDRQAFYDLYCLSHVATYHQAFKPRIYARSMAGCDAAEVDREQKEIRIG
jgi:glycosyltransferase involved in cell wall biosynthesis